MSMENRCFCDLAPLYVLGLLSEEDNRWVEAQIAQLPDLEAEVQALQATVATVTYAIPSAPIAAEVKDRLFQQLDLGAVSSDPTPLQLPPADNVRQLRGRGDRPVMQPRRRWIGLSVGGAVAAILIGAILLDNFRLKQDIQAARTTIQEAKTTIAALQKPDSIVYTLKGTDKAAQAVGHLIVNPGQKAAVIVAQKLPPLPAGQAYRLWAMPAGATKPLYCGQFNSQLTETTTQWSLPEAACSHTVAQMLITAESASAPLEPAGPLVMKSLL